MGMYVNSYTTFDQQRFVPEPEHGARRSPFARDRARILHSAALRRLAAKTQVMGIDNMDFPRTRLTHTLEVAQIARELAEELGADPDLADLAGLAHDLGHPPFGHNGESALNDVAGNIGGFEGNAQSFRILTRLESKFSGTGNGTAGLNLMRASLDGVIKYPWGRGVNSKKFNVYDDDKLLFDWVRENAPAGKRSFEAQIMDWADDVAYSVHDFEDGVYMGKINLRTLHSSFEHERIVALAKTCYVPTVGDDLLYQALEVLTNSDQWLKSFSGSPQDMAKLKNLTSQMIGYFVTGAVDATKKVYGDDNLNRYNADLIVESDLKATVAIFKSISHLYMFQDNKPFRIGQRQLLKDLVASIYQHAPQSIGPLFWPAWLESTTDEARLRVVIDQVASLTDHSAQQWYNKWCG